LSNSFFIANNNTLLPEAFGPTIILTPDFKFILILFSQGPAMLSSGKIFIVISFVIFDP